MIEWILHRPPHASNSSEIRVAERLKSLGESPYTWIVIWGYYYQDGQGMRREGDFLILGPAGGLLVLEVKSTLPRHFPETGQWEGAGGGDPLAHLHPQGQGPRRQGRHFHRPPSAPEPRHRLRPLFLVHGRFTLPRVALHR